MEILKDAGTFELVHWPTNIAQIGEVARTCYQSFDRSSPENDVKLVENLLKRKHMPMIEFDDLIVRFNNVCRGFTHELVRHRLCSFAQESTRYVDESDFKVVVPPHRDEHACVNIAIPTGEKVNGISRYTSLNVSLADWFLMNEDMYRELRKAGWLPEDARQTLPIAIKSQIVCKANLREWRHIFAMRTSKFAHWEIRRVMCNLLEEVKMGIPTIFNDFEEAGYDKNGLRYFRMLDPVKEGIRNGLIELYNMIEVPGNEAAFAIMDQMKELVA